MLSLSAPTSPEWLKQVENSLEELLIDHALCEKKAAVAAMNLMFAYPENRNLSRAMQEIVQEELDHFDQVVVLIQKRGFRFRKLPPSRYGELLHRQVSSDEPLRAADRLLVAGLIEARSCERFALLRDHLSDPELAAFYGSLFESEARHHSTYVRLAKDYIPEDQVRKRLEELAEAEAEIISQGSELPRMHS